MNKTSDGITSQNILLDNWTTCAKSWVSIYNQIIAITETSGMEANIAPKNVLRLATSEINTIKIAEINTFIILYIKVFIINVNFYNFIGSIHRYDLQQIVHFFQFSAYFYKVENSMLYPTPSG